MHFIRTSPQFTLAGVAHLHGLIHLKAVDFAFTWVNLQGTRYGDDLASQLVANLPQVECLKGINFLSAEGLKTLTALKQLKALGVGLRPQARLRWPYWPVSPGWLGSPGGTSDFDR